MQFNVIPMSLSDAFGDNVEYIKNKVVASNKSLVNEVLKAYLVNNRSGNSNSKTKAEVSGGGKKPWKQKGTGRARAGSNRSPLWRHGGIAFGPRTRDFKTLISKNKKINSLAISLYLKILEGKVFIIQKNVFDNFTKTNNFEKNLLRSNIPKSILLVLDKDTLSKTKFIDNINYINKNIVDNLMTFNVISREVIFVENSALNSLIKRFNKI